MQSWIISKLAKYTMISEVLIVLRRQLQFSELFLSSQKWTLEIDASGETQVSLPPDRITRTLVAPTKQSISTSPNLPLLMLRHN